MEEKTNKKGTKVALVIFIILFILALGALGYGYTKYTVVNKDYDELDTKYTELNSKYQDVNNKLEESNKNLEQSTKDMNNLSEGYVKLQYYDNDDYNVYGIIPGQSVEVIVSYEDSLYMVIPIEHDALFTAITKIPNVKFDSSNKYKWEENNIVKAEIYKFDGKASNLAKVSSSIWYASTDGAQYPILIYKSGDIESTNKETNNNLKGYKIKDFKSEKCEKFETADTSCKEGQLNYKVILQDGTEKTIIK